MRRLVLFFFCIASVVFSSDSPFSEIRLKDIKDYHLEFSFDEHGEILDLFIIFEKGKISLKNLMIDKANGKEEKKEEIHPELAEILLKYEDTTSTKTPLLQAIEGKDYDAAIKLIEFGASVKEQKGGDPLVSACNKSDVLIDLVQILLQKKAEVYSPKKMAPLIYAIQTGRKDVISLLIKYGSDINRLYKTPEGLFTPLDYACHLPQNPLQCSRESLVRFLVERGAHIKDVKSNTYPLFWACTVEDISTAHFLLKEGAEANVHPADKKSPLEIAIDHKNKPLIALLLKNGGKLPGK